MKAFTLVQLTTSMLLLLPLTTRAAGGQWYAGDLHAHSLHSDGDSTVAEIVAKAEEVGLDFFALTDHDSSMGGETPHWSDPDYQSDSLILLYGIEWTTDIGHANIWAEAPFDYQPLWRANLMGDAQAAADAAHAAGALFSINHPTNFSCCPWDPEEGMNDTIEVWNGYHRAITWDYGAVHHFWEQALSAGRPTGIVGGSDMHNLTLRAGRVFTVGNPTTWVYAYTGTRAGILEAIAAGRTSISYGPDAPRVELWADDDLNASYETALGETITPGSARLLIQLGEGTARAKELDPKATAAFFGDELRPSDLLQLDKLTRESTCGPTYLVGLYEGTSLLKVSRLECGGSWEVLVTANSGSWYRVEVLGHVEADPIQGAAYGHYVALSNAIRVE